MSRHLAWLAWLFALVVVPEPSIAADLLRVHFSNLRPEKDFVTGFDLHLENARIVAICSLPRGWDLKAGNLPETAMEKELGAYISGNVRLTHDAFTGPNVDMALALVQHEPGAPPMHINGRASMFVLDGENSQRTLTPRELTLQPARQCP